MKGEYKKGLWSQEEDRILLEYIKVHGRGHWNRIPKVTGLKRCGKSCRLRWLNYLSPNVKHGVFSQEEEDLIIRLHNLLGNRWSLIAGRVPGRTDNQVKNHWNTHLCKKLGIKKPKREVVRSSMTHLSHVEEEGGGGDTMDFEDLRHGQIIAADQETGETSNGETDLMNQSYIPIAIDHHSNMYSPEFMDFLDGWYSLDLMWQND